MKTIYEAIWDQHDIVCNQKYDKTLPYSFHLKAVMAQVAIYYNLLPKNTPMGVCRKAACGHDLIEDARMTYNDTIALLTDKSLEYCLTLEDAKICADIIYACTECRGHNREERHSPEFFQTLKANRLGVFVKLCDIMANVLFSLLTNSSMYEKYQKEFIHLKDELYILGEYDNLWYDLQTILKQ